MSEVTEILLSVPGEPVGQGRPRITTVGGHARAFTPAPTRRYAEQIQTMWVAQGQPRLAPGRPYMLVLDVVLERPGSHLRKDGGLSWVGRKHPYPGKPDLDNIIKLVLDALQGCGAIPDDRLLHRLEADKRWGERAHIRVHLVTVPEEREAAA